MPGASVSGWSWLTRPTIRSPTMQSSISRIPLGRLITSGTTVWGKTTSDRKGSKGMRHGCNGGLSSRSDSTMSCPESALDRPASATRVPSCPSFRGFFARFLRERMDLFSEISLDRTTAKASQS